MERIGICLLHGRQVVAREQEQRRKNVLIQFRRIEVLEEVDKCLLAAAFHASLCNHQHGEQRKTSSNHKGIVSPESALNDVNGQ